MVALERSRRLILPEFISRNARLHPDKAALIFQDSELTYAQLDERTNRLANALVARGVGPGDNVAVLMFNRLEVVEAFFGCHKAGATPVPVNFRLVQDEVDYIMENSGAVGIIADEILAERATSATENVDGVGFHLAVGAAPNTADAYEEVLEATSGEDPAVLVGEDGVAFLMYTSGTTGRPKGAMLTHQNMFAQTVNWTYEVGGLDCEAVWRAGAPLVPYRRGGRSASLPLAWGQRGHRVVDGVRSGRVDRRTLPSSGHSHLLRPHTVGHGLPAGRSLVARVHAPSSDLGRVPRATFDPTAHEPDAPRRRDPLEFRPDGDVPEHHVAKGEGCDPEDRLGRATIDQRRGPHHRR